MNVTNWQCIKSTNIFQQIFFQAPFFPREAVSKGLEVWHFGLVFGAFEITVFIVSPIIGANLNKIGVKVSGLGWLGGFNVCISGID